MYFWLTLTAASIHSRQQFDRRQLIVINIFTGQTQQRNPTNKRKHPFWPSKQPPPRQRPITSLAPCVCVWTSASFFLLLNYINEICQWNEKIYFCAFTHFSLVVCSALAKCALRSCHSDDDNDGDDAYEIRVSSHTFPTELLFFLALFHWLPMRTNCDFMWVRVNCAGAKYVTTAGLSLSLYHNNHLYKMKLLRHRHRTI